MRQLLIIVTVLIGGVVALFSGVYFYRQNEEENRRSIEYRNALYNQKANLYALLLLCDDYDMNPEKPFPALTDKKNLPIIVVKGTVMFSENIDRRGLSACLELFSKYGAAGTITKNQVSMRSGRVTSPP